MIQGILLDKFTTLIAETVWKRPELRPFREHIEKLLATGEFKDLTQKAFEQIDTEGLPFFDKGFVEMPRVQALLSAYIVDGDQVALDDLIALYRKRFRPGEEPPAIDDKLTRYLKALRDVFVSEPKYGPVILARGQDDLLAAVQTMYTGLSAEHAEIRELLLGIRDLLLSGRLAEPEPPPTTVFLSYARADDDPDYDDASKSFMRRLFNGLTAAGLAPWWDRESLPSRGLKFTDEIAQAIRDCDRFVLIVGPGAIVSDYVRAEWTFAIGECKPVMPVLRAGDYDLIPDDLGISGVNAIDCRPERNETAAFNDIIERLRQPAPIGQTLGVKPLPEHYITRPEVYAEAFNALRADAIQTTVISAPAKNQSAVAVYGMGGVGKSTLAAALAYDCQIRRHFHDGIIWIEVGQTPGIASLQASIGVHFGDTRENYPDERDGALSLSRLLSDKTALIVLDDVWDHKLVERFPVSGTASRLLITTRSGKLANLVHGADIPLNTLTPEEGAKLIAEWTGGDPDDADSRAIAEMLGGHTLAITLAAAQIANRHAADPADMLQLLQKRAAGTEPFKDLTVDEEDKDLNLALSLSLSYDALGGMIDENTSDEQKATILKVKADLQRRFRATGIFALEGSFDRAALAAVWGDEDEDDARAPLNALLGAGLLEAADEAGRYMQHRLLHAYARALVTETDEFDAVFDRYADHFTERAQAVYYNLKDKPEEWEGYAADLPDILALGDALVERTQNGSIGDLPRAVEFAYSMYVYVNSRMEAGKVHWLEMGLNAVRVLRRNNLDDLNLKRREAQFLGTLGSIRFILGEKRVALNLHKSALVLRSEIGDPTEVANTLNSMGYVFSNVGEKHEALKYYTQALDLVRKVGDLRQEARFLNNIGRIWRNLGDSDKALEFCNQSLQLRRAVDDKAGEASTLNNIGSIRSHLGKKQEALQAYQAALDLAHLVGNRRQEARFLNNIARIWKDLGEPEKALETYSEALKLRREVGDMRGEATTLNNIGSLYRSLNRFDDALNHCKQALLLRLSAEDRGGEAVTCYNLGLTFEQLGDIDQAIEYVQQGLDALRAVNLPYDSGGRSQEGFMEFLEELRKKRDDNTSGE